MTQTLLKEMTDKKVDYLLSKHTIKDVEVYTVIKEFFKEYLHANYEFTFDELAEELKKVYIEKSIKDNLFRLLKDFSTIEYKDEEIPQEVLRNILSTFSKLVSALIKKEAQKGGLFSKLFGAKEEPHDVSAKPALSAEEEKAIRKETLPDEKPAAQPDPVEDMPALEKKEPKSMAPVNDAPAPAEDTSAPEQGTPAEPTQTDEFQVPSINEEEVEATAEPATAEAAATTPADSPASTPEIGKGPENLDDQTDTPHPSSGDWTDDAPEEERPADDEPFPFELQQQQEQTTSAEEPASQQEPAPTTEPVPTQPASEVPVQQEPAPAAEPVPDQPLPDVPLQDQPAPTPEPAPQQEQPVPDQPVSEVPVQQEPAPAAEPVPDQPVPDVSVQQESMPTEELAPQQEQPMAELSPMPQAQQPVADPIPQQGQPAPADPSVYFGNDDEVLSNDLNSLAEQLDEVIREEGQPAQQPAPADGSMLQFITQVEQSAAQRDFAGAQQAYKELMAHYNNLPEHDKHQYYDKIQALYVQLQQTG